MKTIKTGYYYLFYKLYKWVGEDNWWGDWKAGLSIIALEIWFFLSILNYYNILIDRYFTPSNTALIIIGIIIIGFNSYFFVYLDVWKDYIKEFDQLPKRKNKIGGWVVFGVLMLIIANMVFAFYQMSLIDWSQYR
jgi:hypothetical protein